MDIVHSDMWKRGQAKVRFGLGCNFEMQCVNALERTVSAARSVVAGSKHWTGTMGPSDFEQSRSRAALVG